MNTLKENDYFESSDISLITALCCYGYRIEAIKRPVHGDRATFVVPRERGLDKLTQGFWAHELLVDPLLYFNYLKEIKTRLYQTAE